MGKPHKHAELIKAWADGAEIQCEISQGYWCDIGRPDWDEEVKFRIKPEPPEYPQTKMTDTELQYKMPVCTHEFTGYVRRVANAAIARAIEDGQVVRAEDANQQVIDNVIKSGGRNLVPDELLMAVAQEVRRECVVRCEPIGGSAQMSRAMGDINLGAIIAYVKEGKP